MISHLIELNDSLITYYEDRDSSRNSVMTFTIDKEQYIMEKKESIVLIKELLLHDISKHYNRLDYILTRLISHSQGSTEFSILTQIKQELGYTLTTLEYPYVGNIKKLNAFKEAVRKKNRVTEQYNHFNSFCSNQNNFDNMISIIKVIRRLQSSDINIDINSFEFNTQKDLSEIFINTIMSEGLKDFGNIRFLI